MREETGVINAQVESSVSGIRVSKAYTASDEEMKKFDKTKIQRWRLFFGGDGIGKKKNDDSRIRYSDAQWY